MFLRALFVILLSILIQTVHAAKVDSVAGVKDMSDAHVNWALQESKRIMASTPMLAYQMLEYYFFSSQEERKKVIAHIADNPDLIEGGVKSFNKLVIHDIYKELGFNKNKTKKAVQVKIKIFKDIADAWQLNRVLEEYIEYFYKGDVARFYKVDELALLAKENKKVVDKNPNKFKVEDAHRRLTKAKKVEIGDYKYGKWYVDIGKDELTDEIHSSAYVFGPKVYGSYASIGIRCFSGLVKLTFNTVRFVDFSGGDAELIYRVDKESPEKSTAYLYRNSSNSGYGRSEIPEELVLQMKKGSKILLEVSNKRGSNIYQNKFSLSGFTKAYDKVWRNCK